MNIQHRNQLNRLTAWLIAGGMACALAACGGGGSNGNNSMPGTSSTGTYPATNPTPMPSPAPTPSMNYAVTSLVSDNGGARNTDPHLVNGWGLAFNPAGFAWVADNGTSNSTLYDGNGLPQSLVVSIPAGQAGDASPTGIVFNGTADFRITQGNASGTGVFIFAGEAGTISAWAPNVNATMAVTVFDGAATNNVYKGLAIGVFNNANYVYATDFHNKTVNVFDGTFTKAALPGTFTDPSLPAGYAPYGIQNIDGNLYVSFAEQDAQGHDQVPGAGLGLIDVFDTGGNFIKRFATGGALNAAWGMAKAPANFGAFSNDILISNFGDGKINAFDPNTGQQAGTLGMADGTPIVIDGLWGIAFGNGINNQPTNTLFFTAGPANETHGLYGRIDVH